MATPFPKWEALQTVGSNGFGCQVDGAAVAYVGANDYYWSSVASGGTSALLTAWANLLQASVASTTVTLDDATGIITITWGSGTHTLTWSNTTVRDRFGATGNFLAAAATLTMQNQCKGLWLPNTPPAGVSGTSASIFVPESDRQLTVSRSGAPWGTSNAERGKTLFEWRGLTKAKTRTANESRVNESFETMWRDALNVRAGIFRHHPDRAVDGTYQTCYSALTEDIANLQRFKGKQDPLWNLDVPAREYVHVTTGGGF